MSSYLFSICYIIVTSLSVDFIHEGAGKIPFGLMMVASIAIATLYFNGINIKNMKQKVAI